MPLSFAAKLGHKKGSENFGAFLLVTFSCTITTICKYGRKKFFQMQVFHKLKFCKYKNRYQIIQIG